MSEALYERYKEALRRGHVASQRARFDEALDAYSEAARVAPDRALPLVGIGLVLTRLGKTTEALSAFDLALDRAPTDETALRGRVDALTRARRSRPSGRDPRSARQDPGDHGPAVGGPRRRRACARSRGGAEST